MWLIQAGKIIFPFIKPIYKYLKNRRKIKKLKPGSFSVVTKTNNDESLYTSGEVISVGILSVKIRGTEQMTFYEKHGDFEIKIFNIINIAENGSSH